jgi:phosphoglycolate phosphatase
VDKKLNIVFDLDGTLIDSAPDIQSAASSILKKLGKNGLTLPETRSFIGEGAAVFVRRLMAARGIEETTESHRDLLQDFLARYELSVDKAVFYPGVERVLEQFKAAGHPLGLCTNKPEKPTRAVLKYMGMDTIFDAIMAGGMIDSRKPEPEMLLKTVGALSFGPTLYVGDSEIDAETARRADVPFALFSEGYRKTPVDEIFHDWTFDEFGKLPGIVVEADARIRQK